MDPFSIAAALGLMLAGTYFKQQGNKHILQSQGQLSAAERERQGRMEQEKQAAVQGALPQLGRPAQEQQQQSISEKLRGYFNPSTQAPAAGDFEQNPGAPQEIKDRKAAVLADAESKARDYAARLADVSSYNLLNFGNTVNLNRTGEHVGNLVNSQINSSAILPFELQHAAQTAGARDMLYSDLASGAGTIAGLYAARGPTAASPDGALGDGIKPNAPSGATGIRVSPGPYGSADLFRPTPGAGAPGLRVPPNMYRI